MNRWHLVALVVLLAACEPESTTDAVRGVRPVSTVPAATDGKFRREQSAALFVGVREFAAAPSLSGVRFTVDDAIDLAYTFSLERNVRLVEPRRVALALAGNPHKALSAERLKKLQAEGAVLEYATLDNVQTLLQQQARLAGKDGLLILGFASHGFSRDGVPYILASTSRYEDTTTSLSAARVRDIADASPAQRSLIFIDACRERLAGARGAAPLPPSQPLGPYMAGKYGQVIFYAAAPGNYAYEDDGNGVFTRAFLTGLLACGPRNVEGVVTVDKLARFVEDRVRAWIQKNRGQSLLKATQVSMDTDTKSMPLASCSRAASPESVAFAGEKLTAFARDARRLWRRTVGGRITHAEVADVDGRGPNEVLVVTGSKLVAIDALDEDLWSIDTKTPIRKIVAKRLFSIARKLQVIAISDSRLSIVDNDGSLLGTYSYPGIVKDVVIDQPTARHEWKIIVTLSNGRVFMLDPDTKPRAEVWSGMVSVPVKKLTVIDFNNDGERDIELTTAKGRMYLDFEGRVLKTTGPRFELDPAPRPPRSG